MFKSIEAVFESNKSLRLYTSWGVISILLKLSMLAVILVYVGIQDRLDLLFFGIALFAAIIGIALNAAKWIPKFVRGKPAE